MPFNENSQPEMQAILAILRQSSARVVAGTFPASCSPETVKRIMESHGDKVIDLAGRHRVIPLLYSALSAQNASQSDSTVRDSPFFVRLKNMNLANAARNIRLTGKLFDMIRLFENGNIRAVTFKGPVMTASLYGDTAMRQISDLDFMVHPDDLHNAKALLAAHGFHAQRELKPEEERIWEKTECGYDMSSHDGDLAVDIRSRITPDYLPFNLTPDEVFTEQMTWKFEGREIRTFSFEMQFLLLCYHGAKHLWHRLSWITDISMLSQSGKVDWKKLFDLADRSGGTQVLGLGLKMAETMFEVSLPKEACEWQTRNPVRNKMVQLCTARLYECQPEGSNWREEYAFYLKMRMSLSARVGYLAKMFFRPTCSDYSLVHLPENISFLYYFLRPLRLAMKICGLQTRQATPKLTN